MADNRDSMASGLLESLGEEELLAVLAEGVRRVPAESRWRADDAGRAARVRAVVRTILERSFPTLRAESELAAIEGDVAVAILAHDASVHRLERLAATLRARDIAGNGEHA
jgi:hypothetical protein